MGLMISCNKATELVEKKSTFGITSLELAKLRFHNLICKGCKIYEKQSKLIDVFLKDRLNNNYDIIKTNNLINSISSENLKEKIIKGLE